MKHARTWADEQAHYKLRESTRDMSRDEYLSLAKWAPIVAFAVWAGVTLGGAFELGRLLEMLR